MWPVLKVCNIESNMPNIPPDYHSHFKPFPVQFSFRQTVWWFLLVGALGIVFQ